MAVPAHLGVRAARAAPTRRVRATAVSADLVATNAIRGRTLVVTGRAGDDVAPRLEAVQARHARGAADPARWVDVSRAR